MNRRILDTNIISTVYIVDMNKVNDYNIISFGDECTIAKNLNHLTIRNSSMPFDWFHMYGFQEILNLLYSKQYISLQNLTKIKNIGYNNILKIAHIHENLNNIEEEESKFKRRLDKLYDLFDTDNNIIFIKYYRPDIKVDQFSHFFPDITINGNENKILNDRIINDCVSFTNFVDNINKKYNKHINIKFIQICPIKTFIYKQTIIDNINHTLNFKNCIQFIINESPEDGDFSSHSNNFHNKHVMNCLKKLRKMSYNDINTPVFV